jgi:hypothetical protein
MGDPSRKAQVAANARWKRGLAMSKMADQLKQQLQEAQPAAQSGEPAGEQTPDPALIAEAGESACERCDSRHGEMMLRQSAERSQKQAADLHRNDLQHAHGMRLDTITAAALSHLLPEMAA